MKNNNIKNRMNLFIRMNSRLNLVGKLRKLASLLTDQGFMYRHCVAAGLMISVLMTCWLGILWVAVDWVLYSLWPGEIVPMGHLDHIAEMLALVALTGLLILLWWWESRFDRALASLYRSQRIHLAKDKGHWKAF